MALFPRIQSPCPFKGDISTIMDGDTCGLCKREVFDLTHMSDGERVAFMKGCSGEVCVKYNLRPAIAAATLAAAMIVPTALAACEPDAVDVVFVGGIKDTANVQYVQAPVDTAAPALPVVYEPATSQAPKAPP